MFTFIVQDIVRPLVSLDEQSHPQFLIDLYIPQEHKEVLKDFIILNLFFDNQKILYSQMGLSYFITKKYFDNNNDFIVIEDQELTYYNETNNIIRKHLFDKILTVPLVGDIPAKELIINEYNDIYHYNKVYNTIIYLAKKYCSYNLSNKLLDTSCISQPVYGFSGG